MAKQWKGPPFWKIWAISSACINWQSSTEIDVQLLSISREEKNFWKQEKQLQGHINYQRGSGTEIVFNILKTDQFPK